MIEVFRTNVHEYAQAEDIRQILSQQFPGGRVNFDLEDCDNILRVDHPTVNAERVTLLLRSYGYDCEVLD